MEFLTLKNENGNKNLPQHTLRNCQLCLIPSAPLAFVLSPRVPALSVQASSFLGFLVLICVYFSCGCVIALFGRNGTRASITRWISSGISPMFCHWLPFVVMLRVIVSPSLRGAVVVTAKCSFRYAARRSSQSSKSAEQVAPEQPPPASCLAEFLGFGNVFFLVIVLGCKWWRCQS